ncbi:MAG: hypothetical protein ACREJO_14695 [Phycisphaerales bacterium]
MPLPRLKFHPPKHWRYTALFILTFALWLASGFITLGHRQDDTVVGLYRGQFNITRLDTTAIGRSTFVDADTFSDRWFARLDPFHLRPAVISTRPGPYSAWSLRLALWPLCALALIPAAYSWRHIIVPLPPLRTGRCDRCGYDRSRLSPETLCPECSRSPRAAERERW